MKIKDGFVKCKIGEKYLVVTTGELSKKNNIMIELNETSSIIWDCINDGLEIDDIAKKLSNDFSISLEKAKADTQKLIDSMANAGIFE
ncbi:MAG: PqqD family protein [Eubacterium sp.]|nr:PqqD family protein [Eubacterium sp.]